METALLVLQSLRTTFIVEALICLSSFLNRSTRNKPDWEDYVDTSCVGEECTITLTNPFFNCPSACSSTTLSHVASTACNADTGVCVLTCSSGFLDCDGSLNNGCEADLQSAEY